MSWLQTHSWNLWDTCFCRDRLYFDCLYTKGTTDPKRRFNLQENRLGRRLSLHPFYPHQQTHERINISSNNFIERGKKKKTRPKHTYLKLCNITNADPSVIENGKLLLLLLLLWASSSRLHPSITNTKTKQSEITIYRHNPPKSHAKTVQQSERDLHHVMVVLGAWIISVGGKKPNLQIAVASLHC